MKDFLKLFAAAGCGGLTALTALGCGGFLFLMIFAAAAGAPRSTPEGALLVLDLDRPIGDAPHDLSPFELLPPGGGSMVNPARLWEVTDALRRAAEDDAIAGVLVRGNVASDGLRSGWAALTELRHALVDFRASGKPLCAVATVYEESNYYLASAAEHVWVEPMGGFLLNGFSSQRLYFASALDKLGIGVQVTRVGSYKSAVEPFLSNERSEEDREQTELLLGAIEEAFVEGAASDRRFDPQELRGWMNEGRMIPGPEAVELGLADAALTHGTMMDELADLLEVDEVEALNVSRYVDPMRMLEKPSGAVAVVYAEGAILDGESPDQVGGDTLARTLREVGRDDDYSAVVLRVNSPGGSAIASEVILREVVALRREKPVIVSMGTLAASGGYWIACKADHIVAEPSTITGSIGVFGVLPNAAELFERLGLSVEVVKTAEHADLVSIHRAKSPEEMQKIQSIVDAIYEDFLDHVSEGRGMDRGRVAEIAQGRVWPGSEAVELGLVDELGGLERAIDVAIQRADLDADAPLRFPQVELPDLMDTLLLQIARDRQERPLSKARGALAELDAIRREVEAVLGEGPALARLPYVLRID